MKALQICVFLGLAVCVFSIPMAVIVEKNEDGQQGGEFFPENPVNREEPIRPFSRFGPVFSQFGDDDSFEDDDDDDSPYYGYNPFRRQQNLFEFFRRIQENMRRMWEYNRRNYFGLQNGTDSTFNFDRYPPDYNNSTYTVKNVNGSIVSVNETIKKHEGNDSSYFFMWKVVQVKPENATENVTPGQEEDIEGRIIPSATEQPQPSEMPSSEAPEATESTPEIEIESTPAAPSFTEFPAPSSTENNESNDIPKIV